VQPRPTLVLNPDPSGPRIPCAGWCGVQRRAGWIPSAAAISRRSHEVVTPTWDERQGPRRCRLYESGLTDKPDGPPPILRRTRKVVGDEMLLCTAAGRRIHGNIQIWLDDGVIAGSWWQRPAANVRVPATRRAGRGVWSRRCNSMSKYYSKKRLSKRQRASLYSSPEFTARADVDGRIAISNDTAARWRVRGTPWRVRTCLMCGQATCVAFCGRADLRIGARRFASIGVRGSLGGADARARAIASSSRLGPSFERIERRGLAIRSRSRAD
jgi:hypothetical protein